MSSTFSFKAESLFLPTRLASLCCPVPHRILRQFMKAIAAEQGARLDGGLCPLPVDLPWCPTPKANTVAHMADGVNVKPLTERGPRNRKRQHPAAPTVNPPRTGSQH